MAGQGAATVVVAHRDPRARELLARIVERIGQHAVRSDTVEQAVLVDTTVHASALVTVIDVAEVGLGGLAALVEAFATRRYPAQVIALVDGPATAAEAAAAGAVSVLERPFHRDRFVASLAQVLGIELPKPAEPPAPTAPLVEPAGR